jgi:hypothetical protein
MVKIPNANVKPKYMIVRQQPLYFVSTDWYKAEESSVREDIIESLIVVENLSHKAHASSEKKMTQTYVSSLSVYSSTITTTIFKNGRVRAAVKDQTFQNMASSFLTAARAFIKTQNKAVHLHTRSVHRCSGFRTDPMPSKHDSG